jgi:hypothetical protein
MALSPVLQVRDSPVALTRPQRKMLVNDQHLEVLIWFSYLPLTTVSRTRVKIVL